MARDGLWQSLEDLRVATGLTIILTTHYMEEADALCDRVALMHLGRIRVEGAPTALKAHSVPMRRSKTFSDTTPEIPSMMLPAEKEVSVKSGVLARPQAGTAEPLPNRDQAQLRRYPSRVLTFCIVELQKLRHDRTELITRAIQPILWLLVFGETFNRLHIIPTDNVSYLAFLAPGIVAQSGLFVAIFYGIQIFGSVTPAYWRSS